MNHETPTGVECTADDVRSAIERLFNTAMQISLNEWGPIANRLLYAAHAIDRADHLERQRDELLEAVRHLLALLDENIPSRLDDDEWEAVDLAKAAIARATNPSESAQPPTSEGGL